jgi:Alpha/beta hydrolase family
VCTSGQSVDAYRKSCLDVEPAGVGTGVESCHSSANFDILQRPGTRRHRSEADPGRRRRTAEYRVVGSGRHRHGDGMCGFLFYGEFLAAHGVHVVLMDFCDYGQSDCGDAPPQLPAQVEAVTRAVRDQGAKRVVLVGASLGGSVAVAAAKRTKADAIVDLSGPADFGARCRSQTKHHQ